MHLKSAKIAQTFSAALALQANTEVLRNLCLESQVESAGEISDLEPRGQTTHTPGVVSAKARINLSHVDTAFSVKFLPADEWDAKSKKRYHYLAIREAKGTLSKDEAVELESLERLQQHADITLSPEQILENYRREKAGFEMLNILTKYVRVIPKEQNTAEGKAS